MIMLVTKQFEGYIKESVTMTFAFFENVDEPKLITE